MRRITSINPATGELLREFQPDSDSDVERKLDLANAAFAGYRRVPLAQRAEWLRRAAELLESEKEAFGRTMTLEMGKPIRAAIQEAEKCANGCRFYAEHAARFLEDEPAQTAATRSLVRYQPLGPVLAIMPWNFPFWQVFRFAAPALMAGNVGLLKHASNVPQCALAIQDVFRRAGFPPGVFQTLLIGSDRVERVIADDRTAAVTLTGSVEAGRSVAAAAGRHLKKTVLELGGSDPFIVMPSASLERAAATAVQARVINNGQSCIAAKRFIVHERIADEFEGRFIQGMAALEVGDPLEATTDVGPLATAGVLNAVEEQVRQTVTQGAKVLLGGHPINRPGFFYAPTVLRDIPTSSPAHRDEIFGPVASLFRAGDLDEALRLANDTPFGLGSCIWTNDQSEREQFIDEIQAGLAFVNGMVASDPRVPFGGIKHSGYGRELSRQGFYEFLNIKTVAINEVAQAGSGTE